MANTLEDVSSKTTDNEEKPDVELEIDLKTNRWMKKITLNQHQMQVQYWLKWRPGSQLDDVWKENVLRSGFQHCPFFFAKIMV